MKNHYDKQSKTGSQNSIVITQDMAYDSQPKAQKNISASHAHNNIGKNLDSQQEIQAEGNGHLSSKTRIRHTHSDITELTHVKWECK